MEKLQAKSAQHAEVPALTAAAKEDLDKSLISKYTANNNIPSKNRARDDNSSRILQASILIKDALHMRDPHHFMDPATLRFYRIYFSRTARAFHFFLILAIMILAYFEPPSNEQAKPYVTQSFELIFLLLFSVDVWAQFRLYGQKHIQTQNAWVLVRIVVIFVNLIDLFISFGTKCTSTRFSKMLRVYYMIDYSDSTHDLFKQVVATLRQMFKFVVGILLYNLGMTVIAIVLFAHNTDTDTYMAEFLDAALSILTLFTTANFPDIMFPAYRASRWSAVYFLFFLGFGLYLLFNFVIGMVYSNFRKAAVVEATHNYVVRRSCLVAAFDLIDADHSQQIDLQEWQNVFQQVRPTKTLQDAEACFKAVDQDSSGFIDMEEFFHLCDTTIFDVEEPHKPANPIIISPILQKVFLHIVFEALVLAVISANAVVIVNGMLSLDSVHAHHSYSFTVDLLFLLFFIGEVMFKNLVNGPLSNWWLKFDTSIIAISFLGKIIFECGVAVSSSVSISPYVILRVACIFRALRLLRVLTITKSMRVVTKSAMDLLPTIIQFMGILFTLYYFFASIGILAFGGKLVPGDPKMVGTDYDNANYYQFATFNDFTSAMLTLFHLMIVNNWFVTMRGVMAATSRWSCIYFITFYFVGVIILLNLVVAFIIEAVNLMNSKLEEEENKKENKEIREKTHLKTTSSRNFNLFENMFKSELQQVNITDSIELPSMESCTVDEL